MARSLRANKAKLAGDDAAVTPMAGDVPVERPNTVLRMVGRVFAESRMAVVGLVVIVSIAIFSFLGPLVYRTNQVDTNLIQANLPPSAGHLLGTDPTGYDVLGRLMVGGRSSLEVGLAAALLASVLGTLWGAVSGYFGGWVDAVMMRVVDSLLAIPPLLLLLLLASFLVPSVPVLIVVIGMMSWLISARLVRGESLSLRLSQYVQAAKVSGARAPWLVVRHILPNVVGVIVVQTTFQVANAILLLASLSFLGLGPPPPSANWGQMLNDGLNYTYDGYWWLIYPPGIAIVLTVVAFNLVGDALRDALDVRLQER
jgi:peptide/nickel transport system permease protein